MEKYISKYIIYLVVICLALIILVPRLNTYLQNKDEESIKIKSDLEYQKVLKEIQVQKQAKKDAEEKIYLTGKFNPAKRTDFTLIPVEYTFGNSSMYLRKEALKAFEDMQIAAIKEGVDLKIVSATRNFDYQANLWNGKWTGKILENGENLAKTIPDGLERFKKILEYSAVPTTSRHHWGTDIDINGVKPTYFDTAEGAKEYEWLVVNAKTFGFCQVYNAKGVNRATGYNEEKWHWSYLPLSKTFTQEYKRLITDKDIKGFNGDQYVAGQDLINNYVLSINPECL